MKGDRVKVEFQFSGSSVTDVDFLLSKQTLFMLKSQSTIVKTGSYYILL